MAGKLYSLFKLDKRGEWQRFTSVALPLSEAKRVWPDAVEWQPQAIPKGSMIILRPITTHPA
jgi:hypothetical protein